jgi:hypothetical protein
MKKCFLSIYVIIGFVAFLGCFGDSTSSTKPVLAIPNILSVEYDVASWDSVSNASSYIVMIDNLEFEVTTVSYDFSEIVNDQDFINVKVKAISNDDLFNDSGWSEEYLYEVVEVFEMSADKRLIVYSNGIGGTVNAITDKFIEVDYGYNKVFDKELFDEFVLVETRTNTQEAESIVSSSMSSHVTQINAGVNISAGLGLALNVFTSSMVGAFNLESDLNFTSTATEIFYTFQQNILSKRIEIEGYRDIEKFTEILDDDFLEDITALENGEKTASEILGLYGTHIVVSGYFGGRIDCNYRLSTNDKSVESKTSISYENDLLSLIESVILRGDTSGTEIDLTFGTYNNLSNSRFYANAIGGEAIEMFSPESFAENYGVWLDSLNESEIYYSLVDVSRDGLLAIWDVLPDQHSVAKSLLIEEFKTQSQNVFNEFIGDYEHVYEPSMSYHYDSDDYDLGVRKVTDDGQYGMNSSYESMDILNLSCMQDYANEEYIFVFDIKMLMNELDSGYQEIWLYNDFNPNTISESYDDFRESVFNLGMIDGVSTISYGGEIKSTSPGYEDIQFVVPGDRVAELMYLKYDANGKNDDDWELRGLVVEVNAIDAVTLADDQTEKTIVDDGVFGLHSANTENVTFLDLSSIETQLTSENTFTILVELTMRQVNKGYQQMILYGNEPSRTNSDDIDEQEAIDNYGMITYVDFIYSVYDLDTTLTTIYITFEVTGDQLQDTMYLRYDAYGDYDDTWIVDTAKVFMYKIDDSQDV